MKFAVQLHALKKEITDKQSLVRVLKAVKEMGFEGVEFAGYYDYSAKELKELLDEVGLVAVGTHMISFVFRDDFDAQLEYAREAGIKNITMAWSPAESIEDIEEVKSLLIDAKNKAEKYGIEISYHNHTHEFTPIGDYLPIDVLKNASQLELDVCFLHLLGIDPVKFMEDNKEYISLLHFKDGLKSDNHSCALGKGDCDMKAIAQKAKEINLEWLILEIDNPVPTALEAVQTSMDWYKANI